MISIGRYNTLEIIRITPQGYYLADEEGDEVLLPNKYITPEMLPGNFISVFIYKDSEDRIVATTENPLIEFGKVVSLEVVEITKIGAFLDWGLEKHLLLPFKEQIKEAKVGSKIPVVLYIDITTRRLVASERLDKYLKNSEVAYNPGDKVSLIAWRETPLGLNVIVDNEFIGLVHSNYLFRKFERGEELIGYVLKVRDDNNIDITLNKHGFEGHDEASLAILKLLKEADDGFLPFSDKSSSDEIGERFQMSKKLFKKSIGTLYRKRFIDISDEGIKLIRDLG
ncbi:MAG: S1-like domain-containing RNA-binding protein [Salinivirgaceae bacterium]|nr:S1-like domain-containing RNA-binding protein [Salinivirgaceae bacterium]MDY0279517.1 S1-like domain-containing RNA-binding protein [Salinivirgaceae bacterium]